MAQLCLVCDGADANTALGEKGTSIQFAARFD